MGTNRETARTDKRVARTRQAIRDALMEILTAKPKKEITVTELSERAGINRKTFYAHYGSVEDVVDELEDELVRCIRYFLSQDLIRENGFGPQYFIQLIIFSYRNNPVFFENLVMLRNYAFLADKIKQTLKEELLQSVPEGQGSAFIEELVEFFVGGITSLYVYWIRSGKQDSFETMTSMAFRFAMNGLLGAIGQPAED